MNKNLNRLLIVATFFSLANASDFERRLELSYVNTSGNTNTSSLFGKLTANAKFDEREIKAKGSILKSKDNSKKSANKYEIELDYNHMLGDRLYTYLGSYYVKDEFSDYDSRLNIGPGLGYKFIYTEKEKTDKKFLTSLIFDF